MIGIPYLYIAIILIIIWTIYRVIALKKSEEKNIKREILVNIFFIYFLIVINLTICKMSMLQINFKNSFYINYIPLIETIKMFKDNFMGVSNALYNVIGNILLFVPLGFFITLLFRKKNNIGLIALYGFLASLAIEIIQLFTAVNLTDIDDIIFNTLGAILGFITFNVFYYKVKKSKLGKLIRSVSSDFNGNLVIYFLKPLSIMLMIVSIFTFIVIYNSTLPGTISDEEIAKEVFKYSENTDYKVAKETLGYKVFLKDEGDYVNLMSVESVLNNRWYNSRNIIGQFEKSKGDYNIGIINEDTSMAVLVFGKNKGASKIEVKFNDKVYSEDLKENEYFVVEFPSFETLDNENDVYNIFEGKESKDLTIKFYHHSSNEYYDMKLAN